MVNARNKKVSGKTQDDRYQHIVPVIYEIIGKI
jgi:hypothetical protein